MSSLLFNKESRKESQQKDKIYYYNIKQKNAISDFCRKLYELIHTYSTTGKHFVLVCIGSDRATGDCLGPIIGYKLSSILGDDIIVYGTLANPVHAVNLSDVIKQINDDYPESFVIAIDASLGKAHHIGYVTLGCGSIKPGIGVDKDLPAVGDIFITGIVNCSGIGAHTLLQTTRLHTVMEMADFISYGINYISNLED